MDGKAVVDSVIKEVIQPGVRQLMENRYFSELRQGKLPVKKLQGWAIQHYLHNKAILKAFVLGMVKNAHDPELYGRSENQFYEEYTHPDLAKKFGLAIGLKEEDFADATQIFECHIHTCRTVSNTLLGIPMVNRASALASESMVCRYSGEFNIYLRKAYGLGDPALDFFTVHMEADKDHTRRSAELIGRMIKTPRDERLVRESAQHMVRIKLGKFEGLYEAYA
ncbi:MAG TPA: iron-containing redox enzyme family protein [Candidatus Binatia bacterium]